jgi:hypothetical protein
MIPTKAKQPTITSPTPAKTKAKSIATQNSITAVSIVPHKPIAVPRGPVISRPFMLTDTFVPGPNNDHPRNTIINIAKIKANFFAIFRPLPAPPDIEALSLWGVISKFIYLLYPKTTPNSTKSQLFIILPFTFF